MIGPTRALYPFSSNRGSDLRDNVIEGKNMTTLTFNYKPKLLMMIFFVVFSGVMAALIGDSALTNDRGLVINRIFRFSQLTTTIIAWAMCIMFIWLTLIGILGVIKSLRSPKKIILGSTAFTAPKRVISNKIISIPYSEIVDIVDQRVQRQVNLIVKGRNETINVSRSSMASKQQFQEMRNALIERVIQSR